MSDSHIHLINTVTNKPFPAAPRGTVSSSSVDLGWQGITVELHSLPPSEYREHYVQGHRLAIMRQSEAIKYEWKKANSWKSKQTYPGTFFLQSHGEPNTPRWFEPFEIVAVAIEPNFITQCFQDTIDCENLRFLERRAEYDRNIAQFAAHFEAELNNNCYGGTLYGESLALAFSLYLLEHHSEVTLNRPQGRFSSLQLHEIIEYTHTNLDRQLTLTQLATQLNLSTFHFARLFKKSLGLSPYKYILQNRIERAKKLIVSSNHFSLSDIALQAGFYDQTHFGKAFKKYTGVSPKVFAKSAS